jgi:glutathione S-transferase
MEEELARHPFLLGDRFTRTDLSVAALFAPMCRPPEHLVRWPEVKEPLASFVAEFEGRPLYEHVLGMYRDHRAPPRAA